MDERKRRSGEFKRIPARPSALHSSDIIFEEVLPSSHALLLTFCFFFCSDLGVLSGLVLRTGNQCTQYGFPYAESNVIAVPDAKRKRASQPGDSSEGSEQVDLADGNEVDSASRSMLGHEADIDHAEFDDLSGEGGMGFPRSGWCLPLPHLCQRGRPIGFFRVILIVTWNLPTWLAHV
jgi:hypothetical protein